MFAFGEGFEDFMKFCCIVNSVSDRKQVWHGVITSLNAPKADAIADQVVQKARRRQILLVSAESELWCNKNWIAEAQTGFLEWSLLHSLPMRTRRVSYH